MGIPGPRGRIFVARFHDGGRDLWCMKACTEHKMCTGMHPPLLRASRPLQRKCRTLMTLMRLFWRLFVSLRVPVPRAPLFHFSPMHNRIARSNCCRATRLIAPDSSLSNAEPSISRRHHALIGSSYFRSHFSSIVDDFYYVIEHDSPFQYPIGII